MWLRVKLPKGEWKDPCLFFNSLGHVEVYFNRKCIFRSGELTPDSKKVNLDFWYFVPIEGEYAEKYLFFRFAVKFISGIDDRHYFGSRSDHILCEIKQGLEYFTIGTFLFLISFLPLVIYFRYWEKEYLYFGLYTFLEGLHYLFSYSLIFLFFEDHWIWYFIARSCRMISFIFLIFFYRLIFFHSENKILKYSHICYIFISCLVSILLLVYFSRIADVTESISSLLQLVIIILMVVDALSVIGRQIGKNWIYAAGIILALFFYFKDALIWFLFLNGFLTSEFYKSSPNFWDNFFSWNHSTEHFTPFILTVLIFIYLIQRNRDYSILAETNKQLRELDKMKSQFISQASHDLRTPLTAIKGSLDNLVLGIAGTLSEKQGKIMTRAVKSVDRLTDLVNDVLDLSRIESGRMIVERSNVPFSTLVENIIAENKPAADAKSITLTRNQKSEYQFQIQRFEILQTTIHAGGLNIVRQSRFQY